MTSVSATLLTFAIDQQRFGIRVEDIEEVIRAVHVARLPKALAVVEGLINLRGAVVAVFDIRSRFGLQHKPLTPANHIIIARSQGRVVGLRVDCALDILELSGAEAIGSVVPPSEYVAGIAKLSDGLLLIHDLTTFLSDAEAHAVDDVIAAGMPA